MANTLYDIITTRSDATKPYLHVVGFKFPDGVTPEAQAEIMSECTLLRKQCGGIEAGILKLIARPNVDPRKGYTWVEIGIFESPEAFIRFHGHEAHKAFAEKIARIADVWVVLDVSMDFVL